MFINKHQLRHYKDFNCLAHYIGQGSCLLIECVYIGIGTLIANLKVPYCDETANLKVRELVLGSTREYFWPRN